MRVHWSASELGLDTRQSAPESALETTAGLHRFAQELGLDPRQSAPESVLESTAGLHTSRCVCAQLCLTLCGPMDCSPPWNFPGKNCGVLLQFPSPGDLPHPGIEPSSPALANGFLTTVPFGKPTDLYSHVLFCRNTYLLPSTICWGDFFTPLFFFQIYPNI